MMNSYYCDKGNRIIGPLHAFWDENSDLHKDCSKEDAIIDFSIAHKKLYLYGAGKYSKIVLDYLNLCRIAVCGVIVSERSFDFFEGKKVYLIEELINSVDSEFGIILAVNSKNQKEILAAKRNFFKNNEIEYFCLNTALIYPMRRLIEGRMGEMIRTVHKWDEEYSTREPYEVVQWEKILIIQLEDAIGDTIWGSAFVRELRRCFPESRIDLLANVSMKTLLDDCPYVDEIIYYPYIDAEYESYDELEERVFSFAEEKVDTDYDAAFLVKALPIHERDQVENVLFSFWCGAKNRIAHSFGVFERERYFDTLWSRLFPIRVVNNKSEHDVMKDLSLLDACGLTYTDTSMELWLSDKDKKKAKRLLNKKEGTKYIAFGLAGREPRRNWPAGNYVDLIEKLDKSFAGEIKYVLFGGDNAKDAADIVNTSKGSIIDLVGKTSLSVSAAVMGLCDLYVGADTSLMHMASASGIPVIELTANLKDGRDIDQGSVVRTGPWHVPSRTIFPKWALDGCTRRCILPYTHCITQIRVDEVFEAVIDLLGDKK